MTQGGVPDAARTVRAREGDGSPPPSPTGAGGRGLAGRDRRAKAGERGLGALLSEGKARRRGAGKRRRGGGGGERMEAGGGKGDGDPLRFTGWFRPAAGAVPPRPAGGGRAPAPAAPPGGRAAPGSGGAREGAAGAILPPAPALRGAEDAEECQVPRPTCFPPQCHCLPGAAWPWPSPG